MTTKDIPDHDYPFSQAFHDAEKLTMEDFDDAMNVYDVECALMGAIYFCNFEIVRYILHEHGHMFTDRADDEVFVDMLNQCLYQLYGKEDVDLFVRKVFVDYVIDYFSELWQSVKVLTRPYQDGL